MGFSLTRVVKVEPLHPGDELGSDEVDEVARRKPVLCGGDAFHCVASGVDRRPTVSSGELGSGFGGAAPASGHGGKELKGSSIIVRSDFSLAYQRLTFGIGGETAARTAEHTPLGRRQAFIHDGNVPPPNC